MKQELDYVENVRKFYETAPDHEDKLQRLRRMDRAAKRPAEIFAYAFGTVGTLLLGTGFCLAMKVIGNLMPLGIVLGLAGIAMISATYSLYKIVLRSRKKKYAERILSLSDEIMHAAPDVATVGK